MATVSSRWIRAMTRLPRLCSSCCNSRSREACCHCRTKTGCSAETRKKIQKSVEMSKCIADLPPAWLRRLHPRFSRNPGLRHRPHVKHLVELGLAEQTAVHDDQPDRPARAHELLDHLRDRIIAE